MSNDISRIMKAAQKLYFIGVGGISMSSLALACKRHGYDVSGSDRASSPITEKLKSEGIAVYSEHRAENISGADAIVYSGAIADDICVTQYATDSACTSFVSLSHLSSLPPCPNVACAIS